MKLTVEDICNFPELLGMRLVAGREGLGNTVTECGILDYEYDDSVGEKYTHTNFQKNQFILTSFLYAKNNEYLVMDAIKRLILRGCSGLAIKNIFRLPLHENLLRYADSMHFPIFLMEDPEMYFDRIIVLIKERADQYASFYYRADKVDALLACPNDSALQTTLAKAINPSLRTDTLAVYFRAKKHFAPEAYLKIEDAFAKSGLFTASDSLFYYKNGFLLIHSSEMFQSNDSREIIGAYMAVLPPHCLLDFYIGVSTPFHNFPGFTEAIKESLYAASVPRSADCDYLTYRELGVYQLLIPFVDSPYMEAFSQRYITPLKDYDAENKTALFQTARQFVLCEGNIPKTAQALSQHKNTIRYRLDRVSSLYGFNVLLPAHYEKLSLAVKLCLCKETLGK